MVSDKVLIQEVNGVTEIARELFSSFLILFFMTLPVGFLLEWLPARCAEVDLRSDMWPASLPRTRKACLEVNLVLLVSARSSSPSSRRFDRILYGATCVRVRC